jgi:hypothetical protein
VPKQEFALACFLHYNSIKPMGGIATNTLPYMEHGNTPFWTRQNRPLITHRFKPEDIEEAYCIFENKHDGVIKVFIVV